MKSFNVGESLRPFIEKILSRRNIAYIFHDGADVIKVDCSGAQFHKAVIRARCEKRSEEERLPLDTTYYLPKKEKPEVLRTENREWIRFLEM